MNLKLMKCKNVKYYLVAVVDVVLVGTDELGCVAKPYTTF